MRDRYTITERLDHGGMAEVFRGVAESMEGFKKSVAIKRILPNLTKNQKFVSIELYQGESTDVSKNRKLGQVTLDDLPPGPPGSVRVELIMTVDVESILSVTAREIKTGRESSVTIALTVTLSLGVLLLLLTARPPARDARGSGTVQAGPGPRAAWALLRVSPLASSAVWLSASRRPVV